MGRYANLFDVRGKVALVAGGTGAIGGEMARALAEYGARVAIAGRSQAGAEQAASRLADAGGTAMGAALDVTDAASVADAVAAVEAQYGPVEVLINAAGTHIEQPADELDLAAWDTVLDTNLRGAFLLSQAAARSGCEPMLAFTSSRNSPISAAS